MGYAIATDLLARILADVATTPGLERCGLLLGHAGGPGIVAEAVEPCRNVAAEPKTRFEIDPAALIAAHRRERSGGMGIVGCYHSHPSGAATPSACDAAMAAANGWLWLIVAGGEARGWLAVADGAVHGRFDPVDRTG